MLLPTGVRFQEIFYIFFTGTLHLPNRFMICGGNSGLTRHNMPRLTAGSQCCESLAMAVLLEGTRELGSQEPRGHDRLIHWLRRPVRNVAFVSAVIATLLATGSNLVAREKDTAAYGEGIIVNIPFPQDQVVQVVHEVVQNGIIRGTKEYNKDEFVTGATAAASVKVFPAWKEPGEVFYKVKNHALDPRNFKESNDSGTLAVRYVVTAQGEQHSVLRINAVFVEDFRHSVHQSNGSVETAEYKDIHDRLDEMADMQSQTAEALREKEAFRKSGMAGVVSSSSSTSSSRSDSSDSTTSPASTNPGAFPAESRDASASGAGTSGPPETLDEQLKDLQKQAERMVKSGGAPLKSAPFHTASTLQSLPAGTEVLIVITTPYWFGIETHDGQHGWMLRDDLELMP
jgi:hypothetical protein